MRLTRRVKALEQQAMQAIDDLWNAIPEEVLRRFLYLECKWVITGSLPDDEKAERLAIRRDYWLALGGASPEDLESEILRHRQNPGCAQWFQDTANRLAERHIEFRAFATQKTWAGDDFYSPRHCGQWWRAVERSDLPAGIRERAADLLRRRYRNLVLEPADIDWLCATLPGAVDLGPEGPWLRDHLEGGFRGGG